MFRVMSFVGVLLACLLSSAGPLAAGPLAVFELEGVTLQPLPAVGVASISTREAPANRLMSEEWRCSEGAGILRVRKVELCRVLPDAAAAAPDEAADTAQAADVEGAIRYRVLVEKGLEHLARGFARRVERILDLDTGWAQHGLRFAYVAGAYDLTVYLARPESVDRLCRPLRTRGEVSCAIYRGAVINALRWQEGAVTWGDDVHGYHHYLVNHEVGHVLGLSHLDCPGEGAPAPIMLQQTLFLEGCTANGEATSGDLAQLERILPRVRRRFAGLRGRKTKRTGRYRRRARRHRRRYRARRKPHRVRQAAGWTGPTFGN